MNPTIPLQPFRAPPAAAALAALPLLACRGFGSAQQFPTAKVNTTGLAVTDTEVDRSASCTPPPAPWRSARPARSRPSSSRSTRSTPRAASSGRKIKIIKEDGASDWPTFAEKAQEAAGQRQGRGRVRLLDLGLAQGGAAGVREGERAALLPDLLRGPGAVARTSSTPARKPPSRSSRASTGCAKEKKAKTFFLIGSDYIWPRTSNKIARKHIENVLEGHGRRRGVLPARPHPVRLADQQDQAEEAGRHLRHRRRRQQRRLLQAAQGRRHHRRQADPAHDLGDRGRDARHRRREHGRLLLRR